MENSSLQIIFSSLPSHLPLRPLALRQVFSHCCLKRRHTCRVKVQSVWEGFVGNPGVMPITPRNNVHGDFTSFRNQIFHFSQKNSFVCLEKMEQNETNPKLLYTLICTTKGREQITTLPSCNCYHHLWRPGIYLVYLKKML